MIDNDICDELLSSYDYDLPEHYIAQHPSQKRDESKLLVLDRQANTVEHTIFNKIFDFLPSSPKGELPLLVVNNSKVIPARVLYQSQHGGKREMLLLTPAVLAVQSAVAEGNDVFSSVVEVLLRPGKSAKVNDTWQICDMFWFTVLEKQEYGKHTIRLFWREDLVQILQQYGQLPLPPYIKRDKAEKEDILRYQTVYANDEKAGSVAAPTAGLHFTPELRQELITKNVLWEEVTLHVGYGTFSPVRAEKISEHAMHYEYIELSPNTAQALLQAHAEGRPIIAVGTTACRVIEGAVLLWQAQDGCLLPKEGIMGWTNIFIYPHKEENNSQFKLINGLITNFHLPQSSLLMLVSALAGRARILDAYAKAVQSNYRFFSYGDAMLIK